MKTEVTKKPYRLVEESECDHCHGEGVHGEALRCPSCGSTDFHIYRSNLSGSKKPKDQMEMAHCMKCNTNTYSFALKSKYKGDDFHMEFKDKLLITFQCSECGITHHSGQNEDKAVHMECDNSNNDRKIIYEEIFYENTDYSIIKPTPEKWHCQNHPHAKVWTWIEEIE